MCLKEVEPHLQMVVQFLAATGQNSGQDVHHGMGREPLWCSLCNHSSSQGRGDEYLVLQELWIQHKVQEMTSFCLDSWLAMD